VCTVRPRRVARSRSMSQSSRTGATRSFACATWVNPSPRREPYPPPNSRSWPNLHGHAHTGPAASLTDETCLTMPPRRCTQLAIKASKTSSSNSNIREQIDDLRLEKQACGTDADCPCRRHCGNCSPPPPPHPTSTPPLCADTPGCLGAFACNSGQDGRGHRLPHASGALRP